MIRTITEQPQAMMIDSQVPIQFWGEAVNTAVYLHQRSLNEGLKKKDDNDGYQAPYETPYEMLHGFGKSTHSVQNGQGRAGPDVFRPGLRALYQAWPAALSAGFSGEKPGRPGSPSWPSDWL